MRRRALCGPIAAAALGAAACGGGGGGLSNSEFRDELAQICSDFTSDVDDVDQPDGSDARDFERFAQDVREIFEKAKADLADLDAPDDLADDYDEFKGLVDDEIDELDDLERAGQDDDADAIGDIAQNIAQIQDRARTLADDLGVDECKPDETETEPEDTAVAVDTTADETLPPTTTTPPTVAPTTTSAPSTTVPVTLPPVTLPATTAPPQTTVPPTEPPDTEVPALFDVVDIPAIFNPFPPFFLAPPTIDVENTYIDIVKNDFELNFALDEMGVAFIKQSGVDDPVAVIAIATATDEEIGVPNAWKSIFCDPDLVETDFYTTDGGFLGVTCDFLDVPSDENPVYEVFTATTSEIGFTIATLNGFVTLDELVDGFLEANT